MQSNMAQKSFKLKIDTSVPETIVIEVQKYHRGIIDHDTERCIVLQSYLSQ